VLGVSQLDKLDADGATPSRSLLVLVSIPQLRERERTREARRGTDATGNRNTTGGDPTHRGPTQRGGSRRGLTTLHVEYAERNIKYGILFIFSLFREYINLEYVRVPIIYRDSQAEYGIHILVAASQEYVNTYSTRRLTTGGEGYREDPHRTHTDISSLQQRLHHTLVPESGGAH